MKRNVIFPLILSLAITAAPSTAVAATSDRSYVEGEIFAAALLFLMGGAVPVLDRYDRLYSGYYGTWTLTLNKGVSYGLLAACDQSCGDIDLELYDENGRLVASDLKSDGYPFVGVTPRWSGEFTLKVTMVTCRDQPCLYGFGLFRE
jgi:hypothetical protein